MDVKELKALCEAILKDYKNLATVVRDVMLSHETPIEVKGYYIAVTLCDAFDNIKKYEKKLKEVNG